MREIKFRGLTGNNEWVYGDLIHDAPNSTAYYKDYSQRIHWVAEDGARCNAPVKNGTVGEFTGLTDKNDTEIYDGDIITPVEMRDSNIDYMGSKFAVEWVDDVASFGLTTKPNSKMFRRFNLVMDIRYWEIIGNIYENPELLESIQK